MLSLLLLALAAPHYPFTCPVAPSCFKSVRSMQPLDGYACEVLEWDLRYTLREFEQHGIGTRDQVCQMLGGVDLRIVDEQTNWDADQYREADEQADDRTVSGSFFWKKQKMMLSRGMYSMAHEMLHAWEWVRLDRTSLGELPGIWEKNLPYLRMMRKYQKHARGLDKETWSLKFSVDAPVIQTVWADGGAK